MALVTDTWGSDRKLIHEPFKMYKTLSATAVSGSAVTDTENFYNKDCPVPVKILGFEVQCVSVSGAGFSGSGSNLTVTLQSSDEIDAPPAQPTSVSWDNVVSVDCSGSVANTDFKLLNAPSNSGDLVNVGLDQTYTSVPKGGSIRATLSAQAHDAIGAGSTDVELLAIVELLPTD